MHNVRSGLLLPHCSVHMLLLIHFTLGQKACLVLTKVIKVKHMQTKKTFPLNSLMAPPLIAFPTTTG